MPLRPSESAKFMIPYLAMLTVLLVPAVLLPQRRPSPVAWAIMFLILLAFVGLRHKVGMDWNNYLVMIGRVSGGTIAESTSYAEPGYALLLWVSAQLGFGIYGANLASSAMFLLGVFRYCRTTPLPWMALAAAFPFLIMVVGMSANRQAAAIGVLLWLLAGWDKSTTVRKVVLTFVAAMFHLSAILFLVFSVAGLKIRLHYRVVSVLVLGIVAIGYLQFSGGAAHYDRSYLSGQNELTFSPGATQHVLLNGLPALLLFSGRRIRAILFPTPLSVQLAWFALALIPVAFVFSLAAGRMTVYLFPVSMFVLSALPTIVGRPEGRAISRLCIAAGLFAITWVWLHYANSSYAHIPYGNLLFMHPWELHL